MIWTSNYIRNSRATASKNHKTDLCLFTFIFRSWCVTWMCFNDSKFQLHKVLTGKSTHANTNNTMLRNICPILNGNAENTHRRISMFFVCYCKLQRVESMKWHWIDEITCSWKSVWIAFEIYAQKHSRQSVCSLRWYS